MGFGVMAYVANALLGAGRSLGRFFGYELAVTQHDHSIDIEMVAPNKDNQAWDTDLFKRGNLFRGGYANPVKIQVDHNAELENPDTGYVDESEQVATDGGEVKAGRHTELITSDRYREYMRQDLISQILNPRDQWKLMMYAILFMAFVMLANLIFTLMAAGVI